MAADMLHQQKAVVHVGGAVEGVLAAHGAGGCLGVGGNPFIQSSLAHFLAAASRLHVRWSKHTGHSSSTIMSFIGGNAQGAQKGAHGGRFRSDFSFRLRSIVFPAMVQLFPPHPGPLIDGVHKQGPPPYPRLPRAAAAVPPCPRAAAPAADHRCSSAGAAGADDTHHDV